MYTRWFYLHGIIALSQTLLKQWMGRVEKPVSLSPSPSMSLSCSERSQEVEELCKNNRQNVLRQKMLTVSINQLMAGGLVGIGDIKTL